MLLHLNLLVHGAAGLLERGDGDGVQQVEDEAEAVLGQGKDTGVALTWWVGWVAGRVVNLYTIYKRKSAGKKKELEYKWPHPRYLKTNHNEGEERVTSIPVRERSCCLKLILRAIPAVLWSLLRSPHYCPPGWSLYCQSRHSSPPGCLNVWIFSLPPLQTLYSVH